MKNNKKAVIWVVILVAVILVGIGFASINNIELVVSGNTLATPNQENFTVKFTEISEISDCDKVTAEITGDLKASISVKDLTAKGDYVEVAYTIKNTSPDLEAILYPIGTDYTGFDGDYFDVSTYVNGIRFCDWEDSAGVAPGGEATLTIRIELLKTPITDSSSGVIDVEVGAKPFAL